MSPRSVAKSTAKVHWLSVIQLGSSGLGWALFWTGAVGAIIYGLVQLAQIPNGAENGVDFLLVGAAMLWAGMLLIPSTVIAFIDLIKRPSPKWAHWARRTKYPISLSIALVPIAIVLGNLAIQKNFAFLLPPFHILAASLTVFALLWIGLRNLNLGGLQRIWGAFASGLTVGPLIATILEFLALAMVAIVLILYITFQPKLSSALNALRENLPSIVSYPQSNLPAIRTITNDPVVLSLLLVNMSLFVPLIEELAKPIAIWFLMWGRKLSPAQGFGLGLLSGAGFALVENLFSGARLEGWAETAFIRIGATAFHLATAGLMGWALVRARNQGKYLALVGTYALSVAIHGTWNGVVVLASLSSGTNLTVLLSGYAGFILLGITLLSVGILILMNRQMQSVIIRRVDGSVYDPDSNPKPLRSSPKTRK